MVIVLYVNGAAGIRFVIIIISSSFSVLSVFIYFDNLCL